MDRENTTFTLTESQLCCRILVTFCLIDSDFVDWVNKKLLLSDAWILKVTPFGWIIVSVLWKGQNQGSSSVILNILWFQPLKINQNKNQINQNWPCWACFKNFITTFVTIYSILSHFRANFEYFINSNFQLKFIWQTSSIFSRTSRSKLTGKATSDRFLTK